MSSSKSMQFMHSDSLIPFISDKDHPIASLSSSMSRNMKSIRKINLSTFTSTSSIIPGGQVRDLSAN